tara:strand:+ start:173 stop:370 length:198 start_codon:yes stop_codon:yes gene_type:complete
MARTIDIDGSESGSISDRQEKKKKKSLFDRIEDRLSNKKNKAPAAKYIQKKKERNKRINDLLRDM